MAAPRGARAVSSERVRAALAGEPDKDAATIVVEDLAELVAGMGQDAGRGDLGGLVEEEVALDRDVMGAEGVASDRRHRLIPPSLSPSTGVALHAQRQGSLQIGWQ